MKSKPSVRLHKPSCAGYLMPTKLSRRSFSARARAVIIVRIATLILPWC